jgi:phage-related protein
MNNALANIKSVRSLITDTKNLIKPTTTGLTGKVLAIGSTEARVLDNNNQRIKANTVFEELLNLKSQSKTGATGFGALNLEELKTIQNKAATLDPVSPNYAKELADIDDYFSRIEKMTASRVGRAEDKLGIGTGDEAKIKKFIDYNGGKPTRQQAINALKASGVIK